MSERPHLFQIADDYGAAVSVDHSSAADSYCCWLRVKGGSLDNNEAAAHLTKAQAQALVAGIGIWLDSEASR